MQLSQNFSLSELIKSPTSKRLGIDNSPDDRVLNNLKASVKNLWQPTRQLLGVPVLVSSGYRCPALNLAIGGAKHSAHMSGFAIDFTAPKFGTPRQIVTFLSKAYAQNGIGFDQMILEFDRWIHLGYQSPTGSQRGQILTAVKRAGRTVYLVGIQ